MAPQPQLDHPVDSARSPPGHRRSASRSATRRALRAGMSAPAQPIWPQRPTPASDAIRAPAAGARASDLNVRHPGTPPEFIKPIADDVDLLTRTGHRRLLAITT